MFYYVNIDIVFLVGLWLKSVFRVYPMSTVLAQDNVYSDFGAHT